MSFKALMLLKNRQAVTHKANATKSSFKYKGGVYIITETDIQNIEDEGKILGAEAIYFEGNPCAVGFTKIGDKSGTYLDEIVRTNALKQTAAGPRFDLGVSFGFLAPLKDPVNIIYLLFGVVVLYGVLAQLFGWV